MLSVHQQARRRALLLGVGTIVFLLQACGGGGAGGNSGNSSGGGGPGNTPSARPSNTRPPSTPPATQPGQKGTPTPTPTSEPAATDTPTPATLTVFPGQSIEAAARNAPDGAIVVVAPGAYPPVVLKAGDLQGSITLYADVTGEFTNSPPAPVTIVATGTEAVAFDAESQSALALDGFTLRGGTKAAFLCTDCSGITVQDCFVSDSGGDAVRLERSDDVAVYNSLLVGNHGGGVAALGSTNLQLINNTIYNNRHDGVLLTMDENQNASTNAFLRNNILDKNTPTGIVVDVGPPSSLDGFDGDFNLNTTGYSGADPGPNDIATDPLFIFPTGDDFHLAAGSQAIDGGTDAIDSSLASTLEQLTTQTDGTLDTPPLDLGYHYEPPVPTPTRVPKTTRTPTPAPTHTGTITTPGAGTPTPTPTKKPKKTKTPTLTPTP